MRAAVIDLGSCSVRLLVADVSGTQVVPVVRRRAAFPLGDTVAAVGTLPRGAIDPLAACLSSMATAATEAGAELLVARATAAFRQASNGPSVARRISERSGVVVRVVDGAEEARLVLRGQQASLASPPPLVGIDLGGGSLDLAVTGDDGHVWTASVDAGVARLARRLAPGSPPSRRGLRAVRRWVEAELARLAPPVREANAAVTALSGGTARALARWTTSTSGSRWRRSEPVVLAAADVERVARLVATMRPGQIRRRVDLRRTRAALLPVGAAVVESVMRSFELDHVVVTAWGFREGALLDAVGHHRQRQGANAPLPVAAAASPGRS